MKVRQEEIQQDCRTKVIELLTEEQVNRLNSLFGQKPDQYVLA